MNTAEMVIKVVWRLRGADGETCDGCGETCYMWDVHRSFIQIKGSDKLRPLPFALCPECFEEYQKLDQ